MTEKKGQHSNAAMNEGVSVPEKREETGPVQTAHNPFEDGETQLSPEEMAGVEQFKEAQTERD